MAYADIDLEGMLQEETERLEWELEMEEMEEEVDEMRKRQVSNEVKWRRERERALDLRSIQCECPSPMQLICHDMPS